MDEPTTPSAPQGLIAAVNRYAPIVQWGSIALIVLSVLFIARQLPIEAAVGAAQDWIKDLGIWGPVVFALFYVAAVTLLVPGSALTLAAGALFGLLAGMILVSLASTTAAALSFLIARYLAREPIVKKLRQYPKFDAIDRAVSEGGWRIVALLRLSPAVPFTLQNYLYGLTGIRFWPCVLTSWLAMLPGTFLYVYLGYVGRRGLEAVGGDRSYGLARWLMTIVGLLATIAVTVYVARLARKAIRRSTDIAGGGAPIPAAADRQREHQRWPWGTTVTAAIALAALTATVLLHFHPHVLERLPTRSPHHESINSKENGR